MEQYILSQKFKINRPIVFLCGPKYDANDATDRRNILREKIYNIYRSKSKNVIPLIVDDFLRLDNDKGISIQLMEEICAAISVQTHIFLDTMSTASELGIFANSAYNNKLYVYIPKKSDVYYKDNIGDFVKKAVVDNPISNIKCVYYRPRIQKVATSTFTIREHYYFNDNKLPLNINKIIEDNTSLADDVAITVKNEKDYLKTGSENEIHFFFLNNCINLRVSIKILFYCVTYILLKEHPDVKRGACERLSKEEIGKLISLTKEAMLNLVSLVEGINKDDINEVVVTTILQRPIETIIEHIIEFVFIYYEKSHFKSQDLVVESDNIVKIVEIGNHPASIWDLSREQLNFISELNENVDLAFESYTLRTRLKTREIVKYKDTDWGDKARKLHKYMEYIFSTKYKRNECSFAYHKGMSIKKCVERHLNSRGFVKLDIKKFFNSISFEILEQKLEKEFNLETKHNHILKDILMCCFYKGKFPLGFVISPILSDFYLNDFDVTIEKYCQQHNLIYTRYADDVMISSFAFLTSEVQEDIIQTLNSELNKVKLQINEDKTLLLNFDAHHNSIRYVGIHVVSGANSNYLSVGRSYINNLAKDILQFYLDADRAADENDRLPSDSVFYRHLEIVGKVAFLKQIEGDIGKNRLAKRIKKYLPNLDLDSI